MKTTSVSRRTLLQQLSIAVGGGLLATTGAFAKTIKPAVNMIGSKPVVVAPGAGEKGTFGGIDAIFKLDKAQTGGRLACVEMTLKPGRLAAPPHLHHNFDEICYLQEGTLQVMIGQEVSTLSAGSWHIRPRGVIHTFWNPGTKPAKVIELYTPGGFEAYLKGLAKLFKNNPQPPVPAIMALGAKHDMILHFELLKGIMEKYHVQL